MKLFHSYKHRTPFLKVILLLFVFTIIALTIIFIRKGFSGEIYKTIVRAAHSVIVTETQSNKNAVNKPEKAIWPTHDNIITTVFWVGESANIDNGNIANGASAWDERWVEHFGGIDAPGNRRGFYPTKFIPKENPFYFALPYSDLTNAGMRKQTAVLCVNSPTKTDFSWCKNTWIEVTHGLKKAYAQWEDTGPYQEDDTPYVFGTHTPLNIKGTAAGLDVSPALQGYLQLADVDKVSWRFISYSEVPAGPWKTIITAEQGSVVSK